MPVDLVYDSSERKSASTEEIFEIFRYKDLVLQLIRRDIVTRYKRSVLGILWTMLNPLGMMLVLTLAFANVFQTPRGYASYVLTGLVAWMFFSQGTVTAMKQLLWGGPLIHHIYIPKTVFAISAIGTALVNLLISMIPVFLILLVLGTPIQWTVLFLPVSILFLAAFALGIGLLLSRMAAYFWDVSEIFEIAITAWTYLTPIIYPEEILPDHLRPWMLALNPMYHLIKLFRLPLYYGEWPSPDLVLKAALIGLGTLAVGWLVFTRKANELAYRI